jgi:GTP cyclohydrolase I
MESQPSNPQVDEHSVKIDDDLVAQHCVRKLIEHIGEDCKREGLKDTPKRVVKSYKELFAGYSMDPAKVLSTTFTEPGADEIVICRGIEMYSTCEHHLQPFFGKASVGYIPSEGKVVGLSKLARVVEVFSRRLQNQERITKQVAEAIWEHLKPLAVGVVIEAEHFCMRARGVNKQNSVMVTSCMMGVFREDRGARSEFLRLIGK